MTEIPARHNPAGARYDSVLRPHLFAGELHWVTGGGSGIGRCVAHELAALGATVVISGRSADKLERVAAEIREDGGRVETQKPAPSTFATKTRYGRRWRAWWPRTGASMAWSTTRAGNFPRRCKTSPSAASKR